MPFGGKCTGAYAYHSRNACDKENPAPAVYEKMRTGNKALQATTPRTCFPEGFALTLILFTGLLLFIPFRYEVNDDLQFINILSGKGGFSPDFRSTAQSLSQLLSYLLYTLYAWFPSIPWYGITIYFAAYLGTSLIISVILRSTRSDRPSLVLSVPFLLIFFSHCFTVITYTSAALLLEFGVFLCLLEHLLHKQPFLHGSRTYMLLLAICFFLAYLIRWKVVLFFSVAGLPVFLFAGKNQSKSVLIFILSLSLLIFSERVFFSFTATPLQREYLRYTELRRAFHDTVKGAYHGEMTENAMQAAKWNRQDYAFFRSWILYDDRVINAETLSLFLRVNSPLATKNSPGIILEKMKKNFLNSTHHSLLFACTLFAVYLVRRHGFMVMLDSHKGKILCSGVVLTAGALFLMYFYFQFKVFVPLYIYMLSFFLVLSRSGDRQEDLNFLNVLLSVVLFIPILLLLYSAGTMHLTMAEDSRKEKEYILSSLKTVQKQQGSEPLLVLLSPSVSGGLGGEKVHPLRELSDYTDLRIFPAGTEINSPRYISVLRQMGLKSGHDFLNWTMNRNDALFVQFIRSRTAKEKMKYLWESYFERRIAPGAKVVLEPVYDFRSKGETGLIFYRMKKRPY